MYINLLLVLENESNEDALSKKENEKKRKRPDQDEAPIDKVCKNQKLSEKEIANLRPIPKSKNDDGPQIVVTLDGLDSKTIKDIILRNKEAINGPILSSRKDKETKEKSTKRASVIPKEKSPSDFRKLTFEKISDRFGRLNKTHENTDSDREKGEVKNFKLQNFEKNKEKSSTESKNRQLIAQLSEKFGKVDREFENKKRRYPEQDRRYLYDSRKGEREDNERNGKYKRSERRSNKEGSLAKRF